jgi:hypothetical protein
LKIVRQLIISGFLSDANNIQVDTLYFFMNLFSSLSHSPSAISLL